MRFSPQFLDELRARVPVSEVVRGKVRLKKEGREWRGLSPFNAEKTPSFYVNDQKGFFHDFSSGKHGDAFNFLMETEGVSFPEAVEKVAGLAGVPLPVETREQREGDRKRASLQEILGFAAAHFQKLLKGGEGQAARDYLAKRGVSLGEQAQFGIGYASPGRHVLRDALAAKGVPVEAMIEAGLLSHGEGIAVPYDSFRDRVMFPICDRAGKVIAFGGRALAKDAQAKYKNSPETPLFHKGATLYNLHNARKHAHEAGTVIAVEGYVDVIAMTAAGFPNVVAPLGTALTEEQCGLLWRMGEEPILCFDGDKAGLKAAYRAIDTALPLIAPGKSLRFVLLPEGQDPDELLRNSGASAVAEALRAPLPLVEVLWRRETESAALDTPERRTALRQRLRELANQIRDPDLRGDYSQEFSARLAKLFGSGEEKPSFAPRPQFSRRGVGRFGESGPVRPGAALANSPLFKGQSLELAPREALILLIFINHIALVGEHLEELAELGLSSKRAQALRNILVENAISGSSDRDALDRAITKAGLSGFLARLRETPHAKIPSVRADAPRPDAQACLKQALVLHRRVWALNRELQDIEARLASDPCEEDAARLAEIQRQLTTLDGTEAALEGFGSGSSRVGQPI